MNKIEKSLENSGYVQEVGFILRYFFIECPILFPINVCRLQIFIVSFLYKTKMISLAKVTKTREFAFPRKLKRMSPLHLPLW